MPRKDPKIRWQSKTENKTNIFFLPKTSDLKSERDSSRRCERFNSSYLALQWPLKVKELERGQKQHGEKKTRERNEHEQAMNYFSSMNQ